MPLPHDAHALRCWAAGSAFACWLCAVGACLQQRKLIYWQIVARSCLQVCNADAGNSEQPFTHCNPIWGPSMAAATFVRSIYYAGPHRSQHCDVHCSIESAGLQQPACSMGIVPEELCLHSQSPQHRSFCSEHLHIDVQPAVHHIELSYTYQGSLGMRHNCSDAIMIYESRQCIAAM